MPKLLQINVTANWGSTGKIAEDIGKTAIANGWESYIAYGRDTNPHSLSNLILIGNKWDMYNHGIQTRIFDNHGLASINATKKFIDRVKEIKPDIIHLHNIHGYYINYDILFDYLSKANIPVVWTLHDCWPFTGHCAYFDYVNCCKWKYGCIKCMYKSTYPSSYILSSSEKNYLRKRKSFTSVPKLYFVPVSNWLHNLLNESFFAKFPKKTIHNGVDLNLFVPTTRKFFRVDRHVVLGVASVWEARKGLVDFIKLRELLPRTIEIILIGLSKQQIDTLPSGIKGISRTNNVNELVEYYSQSSVFVNPTWEDNFPTTNIEALACGTPVVTYRTGGSPESITPETGIVVEKGDCNALCSAIMEIIAKGKDFYSAACRKRAEDLYNKDDRFQEYLDLYQHLLSDKCY